MESWYPVLYPRKIFGGNGIFKYVAIKFQKKFKMKFELKKFVSPFAVLN